MFPCWVRRTQSGNNNAYCQDDETSWFDWTLVETHADVHRFVTLLNARRVLRTTAAEEQRVSLTDVLRQATTAWHGVNLWRPDWEPNSHSLACGAELRRAGLQLHLIMNAYWEPLDFELPPLDGGSTWHRWIDTSLASPDDIMPWQDAPAFTGGRYRAGPRSVVVLWTSLSGKA